MTVPPHSCHHAHTYMLCGNLVILSSLPPLTLFAKLWGSCVFTELRLGDEAGLRAATVMPFHLSRESPRLRGLVSAMVPGPLAK